jgi:ethanolamine utilization protein EutQ (cupin superfamily)
MKRVISAEHVQEAHAAGQKRLEAPREQTLVTPAAWTAASLLGVAIDLDAPADAPLPDTRAPDPGACERVVDASGVVLVRGGSLRLGRFDGAGPDKNIGLTDVITARDGSPMTAGVMSWHRKDSFPWALDYDEVDLVLEGVLQIHIGGNVLEGRAGDVFYIPKGSRIVFGTPSRTRVFYVTYPADWAAASAGMPGRPQG